MSVVYANTSELERAERDNENRAIDCLNVALKERGGFSIRKGGKTTKLFKLVISTKIERVLRRAATLYDNESQTSVKHRIPIKAVVTDDDAILYVLGKRPTVSRRQFGRY